MLSNVFYCTLGIYRYLHYIVMFVNQTLSKFFINIYCNVLNITIILILYIAFLNY